MAGLACENRRLWTLSVSTAPADWGTLLKTWGTTATSTQVPQAPPNALRTRKKRSARRLRFLGPQKHANSTILGTGMANYRIPIRNDRCAKKVPRVQVGILPEILGVSNGNGRRSGGAASKRRQTNRKHSPLVLERLLAKQEADRAYIRPWLSQTAARLHAVGGWEGLDFACGPEEPAALVGEIPLDEVQGSAASVLDNVLDPSWCRLLVKRHMEVGFTPQADVDKLRKEAEREAVGRKGVAAALRDADRLRRELGIQGSFVESGKNTSEALTIKSWKLADLLWQRCGPCIPPELREPGLAVRLPLSTEVP